MAWSSSFNKRYCRRLQGHLSTGEDNYIVSTDVILVEIGNIFFKIQASAREACIPRNDHGIHRQLLGHLWPVIA